jgi:TP901 family phage tail tape measure protein
LGQTRIDLLINLEYQKQLDQLKKELKNSGDIKINTNVNLSEVQRIKTHLDSMLGGLSDFKFTTNAQGQVKNFFATYQNELNQTVKAQYKLNEIIDKNGNVTSSSLDLVSQKYTDGVKKREQAELKSNEAIDKAFITSKNKRIKANEVEAKIQNQILDNNYKTQTKQQEDYSKAESSIRKRRETEARNEAKIQNQIAREKQDALQKERVLEQDKLNNLKLYSKEYQRIATLQSKGGFDFSKQSVLEGGKLVGKGVISETPELTRFFQDIDDGTGKIRKYTMETDKATGSTKILSSGWKEAQRNHMTFNNEMAIAIRRIAEWAIATTVVYGSLRKFQEGIKFVYDLSNSLNQIRIVTGKTAEEVGRLGKEYNQLAKDMGVGTQSITDASVEFYRQGLKQEEVMNRTEVATKYAKITNEDFTQSAEILTAVVNSMGVDIERASDVMTYLGDATATSGSEIGRAMQKVAGSAGALGIPFEKVTSYIAVISSKTRESAESIGTSMKALLARFQNLTETGWNEEDATKINDVAKALKAVNISLTDGEGQMRRFDIVVEELGTKWSGLDTNTKAYLATTLAG